jgi:hypothetical protein
MWDPQLLIYLQLFMACYGDGLLLFKLFSTAQVCGDEHVTENDELES